MQVQARGSCLRSAARSRRCCRRGHVSVRCQVETERPPQMPGTGPGAGVGVAGTATYFNSIIVPPEDLDNVLTQVFGQVEVNNMTEMARDAESTLQRIEYELGVVESVLARKDVGDADRKAAEEQKKTLLALKNEVESFRATVITRRNEFAGEVNQFLNGEVDDVQIDEKAQKD